MLIMMKWSGKIISTQAEGENIYFLVVSTKRNRSVNLSSTPLDFDLEWVFGPENDISQMYFHVYLWSCPGIGEDHPWLAIGLALVTQLVLNLTCLCAQHSFVLLCLYLCFYVYPCTQKMCFCLDFMRASFINISIFSYLLAIPHHLYHYHHHHSNKTMANIIIRNVFSLKPADKLISGAEYEEKG